MSLRVCVDENGTRDSLCQAPVPRPVHTHGSIEDLGIYMGADCTFCVGEMIKIL